MKAAKTVTFSLNCRLTAGRENPANPAAASSPGLPWQAAPHFSVRSAKSKADTESTAHEKHYWRLIILIKSFS
jgi:hypothetical protein